jgi:hypothetical protein
MDGRWLITLLIPFFGVLIGAITGGIGAVLGQLIKHG